MVNGGGHPTHAWFGMYYAGDHPNLKVVPVPVFQAIDCFIIWGLLVLIERRYRTRPTGFVLAAAMGLWGLARFFEERFWLGEIGHLGSVLVQAAGLALFGAGVVVMAALWVRHRGGRSSPEPDRAPSPSPSTSRGDAIAPTDIVEAGA
jgi:hypothetical protein